MVQAIEKSCDTYFYDLALRVGIDRIEAMAKRFGFGEATGIDLYGERRGIVPAAIGGAQIMMLGGVGETVITGIGQGYFLATPMQLTVMTAALANSGRLVCRVSLNKTLQWKAAKLILMRMRWPSSGAVFMRPSINRRHGLCPSFD